MTTLIAFLAGAATGVILLAALLLLPFFTDGVREGRHQ